ncbi:MAG TPA: hypothetical protein VEQ11_21775 [Chloroflexota bacterium]|nr:hypothetical protein [Chloroflexota bacterium]
MADVCFYVSGHGFGHAVRDAELLRTLLRLAPELRLEVRTPAPSWIFPPGVRVLERSLDVGVVQPDSLRVEPAQTLARYAEFRGSEEELVAAESAELSAGGVRLVVADAPSAAFAVAARAGLPSIGLANFCWDWIYEPYVSAMPQYAFVVDHLRTQHSQADLLLRLPFHGDLSCFPRIADVPLLARKASADRASTRRHLGLPQNSPLVLLSFGGFDFEGLDEPRLAALDEYAFVATGRNRHPRRVGNLFFLPPAGYSYVDLLAASDAVVAKPGYGIVADCLANRVPVLYTPRGNFREEPILARALEAHGRAVRLPRAALRRWELRPYLERLLSLDHPWDNVPLDGAEVIASQLLSRL